METSTILLIVVLLILLYVVFMLISGADSLAEKLDLASNNSDIVADKITNPTSSNYSYEMWIYVYGSKDTLSSPKNYIFSRNGTGASTKNIGVYLGRGTPNLYVEYEQATSTGSTSKEVLITDNFPLQSWVHVIVSVQNTYMDVYVNGKLVKSIKDSAIKAPSSENPIVFGKMPAYLAKFQRTTKATDPQTAWDNYSAGNGENPLRKYTGGKYGIKMTFSKDDKNTYDVNLL